MKILKRGEITTILAIGALIILGVSTLIGTAVLPKKQTSKTKAAEVTPKCASDLQCSNLGEYCVTCTGKSGGCPGGSGEAEVYQCNGSKSEKLPYSQCDVTCASSNSAPTPTQNPNNNCSPEGLITNCDHEECDTGLKQWVEIKKNCVNGQIKSSAGTPTGRSCTSAGSQSCGGTGGTSGTVTPSPTVSNVGKGAPGCFKLQVNSEWREPYGPSGDKDGKDFYFTAKYISLGGDGDWSFYRDGGFVTTAGPGSRFVVPGPFILSPQWTGKGWPYDRLFIKNGTSKTVEFKVNVFGSEKCPSVWDQVSCTVAVDSSGYPSSNCLSNPPSPKPEPPTATPRPAGGGRGTGATPPSNSGICVYKSRNEALADPSCFKSVMVNGNPNCWYCEEKNNSRQQCKLDLTVKNAASSPISGVSVRVTQGSQQYDAVTDSNGRVDDTLKTWEIEKVIEIMTSKTGYKNKVLSQSLDSVCKIDLTLEPGTATALPTTAISKPPTITAGGTTKPTATPLGKKFDFNGKIPDVDRIIGSDVDLSIEINFPNGVKALADGTKTQTISRASSLYSAHFEADKPELLDSSSQCSLSIKSRSLDFAEVGKSESFPCQNNVTKDINLDLKHGSLIFDDVNCWFMWGWGCDLLFLTRTALPYPTLANFQTFGGPVYLVDNSVAHPIVITEKARTSAGIGNMFKIEYYYLYYNVISPKNDVRYIQVGNNLVIINDTHQ